MIQSTTLKKWSHTSQIKTINHQKRYKIFKNVNTTLESVDTVDGISSTSTSVTLSITGLGEKVVPVSGGFACSLSLDNKIFHKLIINKYNKNKKQYEKDQQTIKSFDKIYKKSLQDTLIDENEHKSLCNILTKLFGWNKKWNLF